ncbi:hypothetical protein EJB05_08964, partial [Eragrostis curvula]
MAVASQRPRSRTASRSTAETAEATHTFEIDEFSLHKGIGAGRFIRSAAFAAGGLDWCVRFYPDGLRPADGKDSCTIFPFANSGLFKRICGDVAAGTPHLITWFSSLMEIVSLLRFCYILTLPLGEKERKKEKQLAAETVE